jgi:diguanylate cyclase (GGDEF)-like protein
MASAVSTDYELTGGDGTELARRALVAARRAYFEHPERALAEAIRCHEVGRSLGDDALCARSRAIQGAVSLHRGDLRGALELAVEAERYAGRADDAATRTELAALKAQLCFFTGSYSEAVSHAELAVQVADQADDAELRIFARRATCMVFGNVTAHDLADRLKVLLELTIDSGEPWEEAVSRNDLACYLQQIGDLDGAEREIDRALAVAESITTGNSFVLAVVHSTRADIRLLAGRAEEALADAERSIALLTEKGDPNPYVLGATVRAAVHARMALGQLDDARQLGEGALTRLGDRVPQTRSLILSTLATALHEAGRFAEAYDALARAAELERQAFRELAELQLSLERATLEISAARRERDALRDQAERDWLTGLGNRRYLARKLGRLTHDPQPGPVSLAVVDLDDFKSINDRFGHTTGDQVLVRVAGLLGHVLRASDVIVRSGGEEFIVLMPLTDAQAAKACCERLRKAIREEPWEAIAEGLTVTTSVGIASTTDPGRLEALVKLADQRLYEAKHGGRDRVVGTEHSPAA